MEQLLVLCHHFVRKNCVCSNSSVTTCAPKLYMLMMPMLNPPSIRCMNLQNDKQLIDHQFIVGMPSSGFKQSQRLKSKQCFLCGFTNAV